MQRVYAPGGPEEGAITLDREESHHLVRVRRAVVGDLVEAFDGVGRSWRCRLAEIGKNSAWLEVVAPNPLAESSMPVPEIWLGTAVPKGDRFDWIVEKTTELGVSRIVPLECDRSVVGPRASKIDRLRRTVIEACKQCGRDQLAEIAEPVGLEAFLAHSGGGELGLFADRGVGCAGVIPAESPRPSRIRVCVGPEGGWTDAERDLAAAAGWRQICLGPHVLRIETAAVAAVAVIWQAFSRGPEHG